MSWVDWIPAITTSGLFAAALWLARSLILARLQASVNHEFSTKLENLRSELGATEERLRAQLREREAEIAALRSGALSSLANRQAMLDKRRLEAIDQLWSAQTALSPARYISTMMSVVKFEESAKLAERDPKAREMFKAMGAGVDVKKIDHSGANQARPFVSPMVWAVHSAIVAVTMHAVMRWQVLINGLGTMEFIDSEATKKLIVAVLPHYAAHLDKYGAKAFHFALEALDARLLQEIQEMLAGNEGDKATVEQAAKIVQLANALQDKDARTSVAPELVRNDKQ